MQEPFLNSSTSFLFYVSSPERKWQVIVLFGLIDACFQGWENVGFIIINFRFDVKRLGNGTKGLSFFFKVRLGLIKY